MFGKLRFRGVDRKYTSDEEHIQDYNAAAKTGRVSLGEKCLYYRDLGRKYFVEYDYIHRAFTRVSMCQPDDSPAIYYYRLVLVHGEKEFANLIFENEADVDHILEKLKEKSETIQIGYVPPADGKRPNRFC